MGFKDWALGILRRAGFRDNWIYVQEVAFRILRRRAS